MPRIRYLAGAPIIVFLLALLGLRATAMAAHFATVDAAWDGYLPDFQGISSPAGSEQINLTNGQPGYFYEISGGEIGSEEGNIGVGDPQFETPGVTELLALAIQVNDTTGFHPLSSDSDPALADIISDIDNGSGGPYQVTAYPFNNLPQLYKPYGMSLASGENLSRPPFDILLSVEYPGHELPSGHIEWGVNLSGEVGNLDGITFLEISDAGAISGPFVPEPASTALMLLGAMAILGNRFAFLKLGFYRPLR